MGCRVRRNQPVVIRLQDGTVQDKGRCRDQVCPCSRQQNAGNNDDQWIKEIQRAVDPAGYMDNQRDHGQIGKYLQESLHPILTPHREQQNVEKRQRVPQHDRTDEQPQGNRCRRELGNREFHSKQKREDDDADLDQPRQPVPFIERRLHAGSRFLYAVFP